MKQEYIIQNKQKISEIKKMSEIMLFSLSNEKGEREWIEETFIKYV